MVGALGSESDPGISAPIEPLAALFTGIEGRPEEMGTGLCIPGGTQGDAATADGGDGPPKPGRPERPECPGPSINGNGVYQENWVITYF
mgnify:CR=1 FL=1